MRLPRLTKKLRKNPKFWFEFAGVCLVVLIFLLKTTSYLRIDELALPNIVHTTKTAYTSVRSYIGELKYFGSCPDGMLKIAVGQQYLCREPVAASPYQKIFDTYPRDPHGREVIYSVLDTGSVQTANDFLNDQYDVPRSKPVTIKQLTWTEDPYNDQYWRFNFYSLRIEKDLLNAALTTHDQRYTKKLLAIVDSFIDTGSKQSHAWDDYHAVAWRTMMLTDIWWKLRQQNVLPIADSNKILGAIQQHADFLAQAEHYNENGSDSSEAAALFLTGVSFPGLPGANGWLSTAKDRLASKLDDTIDDNGALVEHSAYSHFSVLEEYWEIESYSLKHHVRIGADFDSKIYSMINYATYILQPDQHIPMLGASLDRQIHNSQVFADIANRSPAFQYVITKGKKGVRPPQTSMQFASTGLTVLRSGWDAKNYTQQTQAILNYGSYTARSHLDSLGLTLYGGGISLLPGAGLYAQAPDPGADYLSSTSAANTVLVDGKNQERGAGVAGEFISKDDYASQSASEQLNPGVTHERQVTLIGDKTVVVIDKLHSGQEHTYQQLFHLFPGAVYSHNGLTATAQGSKPQQRLQIQQLVTNGVTLTDVIGQQSPQGVAGECSLEYGKLIPCRQLAYTQTAKDATFVTVLSIGKADSGISYRLVNNTLTVKAGHKTYNLAMKETQDKPTSVTASDPVAPTPTEMTVDRTDDTASWAVTNGTLDTASDVPESGAPALRLTSKAGATATMTKNVSLNMSDKNLAMRLKIDSTDTTELVSLVLHSGSAYAEHRLIDSYGTAHGGQWVPLGLAKGSSRDQQGQWSIVGQGFDWSKITGIEFKLRGVGTSVSALSVSSISTYQEQKSAAVAVVFDDGFASIKNTLPVLNKLGFKATVAVIGKYPDRKQSGYLSLSDLHSLKDQGWSIINHSYDHQDAVARYFDAGDLTSYEKDVLDGAAFLSKNGLSTDENWYIDPHGISNTTTEAVVGKYYKFVRTTLKGPESYPFVNPKVVKTFGVQDDTPVAAVKKAIDDANTYHQTLFLTFHRIHSNATDKGGYDIGQFTEIMNYLKATHSPVMSLNQLDVANGVPMNHLNILEGHPSQIQSIMTVTSPSWFDRIKKWF